VAWEEFYLAPNIAAAARVSTKKGRVQRPALSTPEGRF